MSIIATYSARATQAVVLLGYPAMIVLWVMLGSAVR